MRSRSGSYFRYSLKNKNHTNFYTFTTFIKIYLKFKTKKFLTTKINLKKGKRYVNFTKYCTKIQNTAIIDNIMHMNLLKKKKKYFSYLLYDYSYYTKRY